MSATHRHGHQRNAAVPMPTIRRVVPGFWFAVDTRNPLPLAARRRIAETEGAADIVTANGMVLSLR